MSKAADKRANEVSPSFFFKSWTIKYRDINVINPLSLLMNNKTVWLVTSHRNFTQRRLVEKGKFSWQACCVSMWQGVGLTPSHNFCDPFSRFLSEAPGEQVELLIISLFNVQNGKENWSYLVRPTVQNPKILSSLWYKTGKRRKSQWKLEKWLNQLISFIFCRLKNEIPGLRNWTFVVYCWIPEGWWGFFFFKNYRFFIFGE